MDFVTLLTETSRGYNTWAAKQKDYNMTEEQVIDHSTQLRNREQDWEYWQSIRDQDIKTLAKIYRVHIEDPRIFNMVMNYNPDKQLSNKQRALIIYSMSNKEQAMSK